MFPEHRFVLVDPAPFTVQADGRHIIIKQCMFSDELANELKEEYAGERLLFVSDVRSTNPDRSQEENAERIKMDMEAQASWHTIMQPQKSMLKFRLPFTAGTTSYLRGEIFLPVWGPQETTECRLVVDTDAVYVDYDHTEHEQRMFYFNTVTRPALYNHGVRGCGIDGCYDCTAEVGILSAYLGPHATTLAIAGLSADISNSIAHGRRTLASPNVDPDVRRRVIRRNQWVGGRPTYENHHQFGN
jgi:cap2 methyltransferase